MLLIMMQLSCGHLSLLSSSDAGPKCCTAGAQLLGSSGGLIILALLQAVLPNKGHCVHLGTQLLLIVGVTFFFFCCCCCCRCRADRPQLGQLPV
jgi:hypothetical protein